MDQFEIYSRFMDDYCGQQWLCTRSITPCWGWC